MLARFNALALLAAVLLSAACQSSDQTQQGSAKNSAEKAGDDGGTDADATGEQNSGVGGEATNIKLADLFHDEIAVKISDFDYFTACGDMFASTSYMKSQIVPWPPKLKKMLLAELNRMPIRKRIGEAVIGYYLQGG